MDFNDSKEKVKEFWEDGSCGEKLYLQGSNAQSFERQAKKRYELEPYILDFADFNHWKNKKVLEIGVGLGADHQKFAEAGAECFGVDLTKRAIQNVERRLQLFELQSNLKVGDAEKLDFPDNYFDLVYSWGVIHHSPNTPLAAREIIRVLKPGGSFKIMIYNKHSLVGYMLWLRYALLRMKPQLTLDEIYDKYLESPGTKAYNFAEAKSLFPSGIELKIKSVLTHADLLESEVGQRHRSFVLSLARRFWPRRLIKKFAVNLGLFMLIEGKK